MTNPSTHQSERAQAMVVMSLGMIVMFGFVALAIDGGRVYTLQRHAQNAADSAALAAARVQCGGGDARATALAWAAQNGYDNDGITNTVTVNNPPSTGTHAGDLAYVEVTITAEIPNGMAHVIFGGPLQVTVGAMGHCGGDSIFDDVNEALLALGPCPDIKAIDVSGTNTEIIGGAHANDDLYISGSTNHFHGTAASVEGTSVSGSETVFEPGSPAVGSTLADPLASLTTSMYAPGGARVQGVTVYDLSGPGGGKVDVGRLAALGLYNPSTGQMATGVYYAGYWDFELSDSPMYGTITLVTEGYIKSSGSRANLTAYVDGLLMFSNKQPASPCKDWVIDLGGSGTSEPIVEHPQPGPVSDSDNIFRHGVIYAPRGQVMTSGSKSTIRGAIVSQGIKINGSNELIIYDNSLFPPSTRYVELSD